MIGLAKLAPGRENVGLAERPEPELRPGHAVLAVQAAGVCGTDLHIIDDEFRSVPPVTMGHEVCGVVEAVGEGVEPDWLGAVVVTETYFSTCGACVHCRGGRVNLCLERRSIGSAVDGGFAPRVLVPARNLHRVPPGLAVEEAALTEPLACVCHCLLDPPVVGAGDEVLVVGPGPIGLLAAQVARASGGRVRLHGTERDTGRLELARSMGFETSVVGTEVPLVDVAVECSGNAGGMTTCLERVRRGGRYVQVGLAGKPVALPFDEVCYRELTVTSGNASTPRSWRRAIALLEHGVVELGPLVSDVVPLAEWERAIETVRAGVGVKVVFDPR
jgi:L-iditol 2-dehydrogenase